MQKSKDITKYNIHWQIARVQAKKFKDVSLKLNYILNFYSAHKTADNHERIMNWLEGLAMGYRDVHTKAKILGTKLLFEKSTIKEPLLTADNMQAHIQTEAIHYNPILIKECFTDNFNRFKKWANEGYIHEELYEFTYGLLKYLYDNHIPLGRIKITLNDMAEMHLNGSFAPNTYKFKFK